MLPIAFSGLAISQSEQDVTEQHLSGIVTSLPHDVVENDGVIEELVCSTAKIREGST